MGQYKPFPLQNYKEIQSASSFQLWQFVGSLSNPETPGGRTTQTLEPLTLGS